MYWQFVLEQFCLIVYPYRVPILRRASNSNPKLFVEIFITSQCVILRCTLVEKLPKYETITFLHKFHTLYIFCHSDSKLELTLNAPITTKFVCFSRLLNCLRSLYGKQCGPRSDCSYWSSLFWVHAVCFYT